MIIIALFQDKDRINEFADVCWYAMGENPGPVTSEFIAEITQYVDNARRDHPIIDRDNRLAFALYDDDDKIVGTLCVNEDRHFTGCAQFNHFAVIPSARGQMHGRYILNKVREQWRPGVTI